MRVQLVTRRPNYIGEQKNPSQVLEKFLRTIVLNEKWFTNNVIDFYKEEVLFDIQQDKVKTFV